MKPARGITKKKPHANKNPRRTSSQSTLHQTSQVETWYTGKFPELLEDNGHSKLKIGVDFGTLNSCASFVVVPSSTTPILDYVDKVKALHAQHESIRFPSIMAIQAARQNDRLGRIIFGRDVTGALTCGSIQREHVIQYPKLGLIDDFQRVFEADHPVLRSIQTRHNTALNYAKTFARLTVVYPDRRNEEDVVMDSIDDAIVIILRYFLGLINNSLRHELEVSQEQLNLILGRRSEVGFAAPAFWSDAMLDRLLHSIQAAGWPSYCRIWSEPKCALSAYLSSKLVSGDPSAKSASLEKLSKRPVIVCDVGAGTTDLATLLLMKSSHDDNITFRTVTESAGSLCGGRLLDHNIEGQLEKYLETDLKDILDKMHKEHGIAHEANDFLQGFDFESSRQDFYETKEDCWISYRDGHLPWSSFSSYMNSKSILLPQHRMVAAHADHAQRVIRHIRDQVQRTQLESFNAGKDSRVDLFLVGGVTRAKFLRNRIADYFHAIEDVKLLDSGETYDRPLVTIGCILSLGLPAIGGRFQVREAYGVPISERYDPKKHSPRNQAYDEETAMGLEARGVMDWIVRVGDRPMRRTEEYYWSVTFLNDDGTPQRGDPRYRTDTFPLVVKQQIYSTTDGICGREQRVEYQRHPEIKPHAVCEISLTRAECFALTKVGGNVGFWHNDETQCWSFLVPIRVILEWHDVRVTWRAEIPQSGSFPDSGPVWSKELNFATIDHRGHHTLGDAEMSD